MATTNTLAAETVTGGGRPNDPQATKIEIDAMREDLAGPSSALYHVHFVSRIDQDLRYEKKLVSSSESAAIEVAWQTAGLPKADETKDDYDVGVHKIMSVGKRKANPRRIV